jgi:hypothetical protein
MPNNDLMLPLLQCYQDNSDHKKPLKPVGERHVQFRIQLTDSDEPYSEPHRSTPLKSALKTGSAIAEAVEIKEIPMDTSTAAIIKQIQQKYDRRKSISIERQALKTERKKLDKEATCCQRTGCGCCVTGALLGAGLAVTALATASCPPWNAVIVAPFCLTAYFCKSANSKEQSLDKNLRRNRELKEQLAAPESQLMQP